MQFKITFKNPDAVMDAVTRTVTEQITAYNDNLPAGSDEHLNEYELQRRISEVTDEQIDMLRRWIKYSEYVTVVIDTETLTASVQEQPQSR